MKSISVALYNEGTESALCELLKKVLVHPTFDYCLVRFLRRSVGNFILSNPNLKINDISLHSAAQEGCANFNEFVTKVVLKDREDAIGCIHAVIPLVLRISLKYVMLDVDKNTGVNLFYS